MRHGAPAHVVPAPCWCRLPYIQPLSTCASPNIATPSENHINRCRFVVPTAQANRGANRLKLYWDPAISNYTFDGWAEEMMTISRVMPDSVLLPNGQVVVLNGAQVRLHQISHDRID